MNSLSPAEGSFASSRQAVSVVTLQEVSVHLGAIRGGGEVEVEAKEACFLICLTPVTPHQPRAKQRRRSKRASTCARRPSGRD